MFSGSRPLPPCVKPAAHHLQVSLCFRCHTAFCFCMKSLCLPLKRTLVVAFRAHSDYPDNLSPSLDPQLNHICKVSFAIHIQQHSQIWGIKIRIPLGAIIQPTTVSKYLPRIQTKHKEKRTLTDTTWTKWSRLTSFKNTYQHHVLC